MAVRSEFANIDEAIRDRLVLGIRDKDLSQRLQPTSDLTLQKAVDWQHETVQVQLSVQRGELKDNIDTLSYDSHRGGHKAGHHSHHCSGRGGHYGGGAGGHRGSGAGEQRSSGGAKGHRGAGGKSHRKCPNCGRDHERGATCPAWGKVCINCGKQNHFKAVCRSTKKLDDVTSHFFLGSLGDGAADEPPWRVNLTLGNRVVSFKIDTGANVSVIPESDPNLPFQENQNNCLFS